MFQESNETRGAQFESLLLSFCDDIQLCTAFKCENIKKTVINALDEI